MQPANQLDNEILNPEQLAQNSIKSNSIKATLFGALGIGCIVAAGMVAQPLVAAAIAAVGVLPMAKSFSNVYSAGANYSLWEALVGETNKDSNHYKHVAQLVQEQNPDVNVAPKRKMI